MPRVSIGLPVYNGQRYLGETLESLLNQTFPDFEVIVCDNASTDSTESICRSYMDRDNRVRYYRNKANIGAVDNYNLSFRYATGSYFRWTGDDDLCEPTYLEKCVAVLDRDPSVVLCHTRSRFIDGTGAALIHDPETGMFTDLSGVVRIEPPDAIYARSDDVMERFQDALRSITTCHHIYGLMRSSSVRKTGLLGPYYRSDRAFLVEMSLHGKFHEVPEELFLKREHPWNSRSSLPTDKEKANWAGHPTLISRVFPKGLEYAQIVSAIQRSPLSLKEKARCLGYGLRKILSRLAPETAGTS